MLRTRAERWSEGREGGGAKDQVPPERVGVIEEGSVLVRFPGVESLAQPPKPSTDRSGRWDRPAEPFEWRSDAERSSRVWAGRHPSESANA